MALRFFHRQGLLVAALACTPACNAGGAVTAKLELHNDTTGSALSTQSLGGVHVMNIAASSTTYFAMKLASVYLAEDVDPASQNNIGQTGMLWVSAGCTSADDCSFFDFARPTDSVNADLNSQELGIDPGTYRYARMEFCYHGDKPTQPNIEWQAAGMPAPHAFLENMCGVTSTEFNPPLVLKPGDSVGVVLAYDLSQATQSGDVDPNTGNAPALTAPDGHGIGFDDCVVDAAGKVKTCFQIPRFSPGVAQNGGGASAATVVTPMGDAGAVE